MAKIEKEKIKKILIIKLRGIGDVILSSIVLPNINSNFPNAQIDFLTEKPSVAVLETNELLSNILVFNRSFFKDKLKIFFKIRKQKYDMVLDFFSNPSTAQITFFSAATYRAGFPYRGRKYAYNIYGPTDRTSLHAAELHLEFLKNLGLTVSSKSLQVNFKPEDKAFAENFFKKHNLTKNRTVVISPSGGWASKKCEPEKFAEIGREISKDFNFKILIVWGPDDEIEAKKIAELIGEEAVMAPSTSIRQMGALMQESLAVIANDSGPMHLAVAAGIPTLSIHGPTNPRLQGPFGEKHEWVRLDELECIECNLLICPRNHECFKELPAERVINKFSRLLSKNSLLEERTEKN